MQKITKAQLRKRLMESVSKIETAVIKGSTHMTGSQRIEIMKMTNKLLNMAHKLK